MHVFRGPGSHDCLASRGRCRKEVREEWASWEFADYMVSVQKKKRASFAWEGEKKGGYKSETGGPACCWPASTLSSAACLPALFMNHSRRSRYHDHHRGPEKHGLYMMIAGTSTLALMDL